MKLNKIIFILLCTVSPLYLKCQTSTSLDTIMVKHLEATKDICRQLSYINKSIQNIEIDTHSDTVFFPDDLTYKLDSILSVVNEIDINLKADESIIENSKWEGFLPDLLSKAIAALLGFLGAWFIFSLGRNKDKELESNRLKKINEGRIKYLINLVNSQIKLAEDQIQNNQKYSQLLDADNTVLPELVYSTYNDSKRLTDTLSNPLYFESFTDDTFDGGGSLKDYRNITGYADTIDGILGQVIEMRIIAQQKYHGRLTEFSKSENVLLKILSSKLKEIQVNDNADLNTFKKIRDDYREGLKNGNRGLNFIKDQLIIPLFTTIDSKKFNTDFTDIASHMGDMLRQYDVITSNLSRHSYLFKSVTEQLEEYSKELRNLLNGLNKP